MKRMMCILLAAGMLLSSSSVSAEIIDSEIVRHGQYGQVSTITGNGTQGKGAYTLDHPRFPGVDSKGNVYFLDGSQKDKRLRKWDGNKNVTVLDMKKNKVLSREGEFFATGLQVIKDVVYFSSEEKVYKLVGDRATELDENIKKYMRDNHYGYIFRMEQFKGELVFMFYRKGDWSSPYYEYAFASYNPTTREMTELGVPFQYYNPSNFFIQDKGIDVSDLSGAIYYQKFFPRKYYDHLNTNMGQILDVWIDEEGSVFYAINQDKTLFKIYKITGPGDDLGELVAGGFMGFTDGVADEVRMDYPTDFTWDGSGYIFADERNHAIRKLWVDTKPLSLVY